MGSACFNAQERLVPMLRAETARKLSARGLRQERIAEHLGVSQAMVSRYLRRPPKGAAPLSTQRWEALVEQAVRRTISDETAGTVGSHCPVCTSLEGVGLFQASAPLDDVDQCLRHERPVAQSEHDDVLKALARAETWIRRSDFRPLQPAVRINIAMAVASARDARDVAAFPGRLVDIRGTIRAAAPAEFGSSTHLASLIIKIQKRRPEARVIMNLRGDSDVCRAAKAAGIRLQILKRSAREQTPALPTSRPENLLDPGAFGIEPSLYLVGPDVNSVMERAHKILAKLSTQPPKVKP
jgi:XRE family transcriptional regulator, thiamine biosynthesis regulator